MTTPQANAAPAAANPWRRRLYFVGMLLGSLLFIWQLLAAVANLRQRPVVVAAPAWLLAALLMALIGYLLQLCGWLLVMRFLRSTLSGAEAFAGYFLSFLPRYIPGTVWGYLGRGEWLVRSYGISYRTSSLGSLLEAGSFVVTALLIGVWVYLRPALPPALPVLLAALLLGGGAAAWTLIGRLALRCSRLGWSLPAAAAALYLCYWGAQGLALSAVCRGLGLTNGVDLLHLTAASAAGWTAGFLTLLVPAGFGVREWSLTYLLTTQSGMAAADANLVAVVSRLSLIVAELLMLAAALFWRSRVAKVILETTEP